MSRSKFPLFLVVIMLACASMQSQPAPLLQSTDLTYIGGFKVPIVGGNPPATSFSYGGQNLFYRSDTDTLMMTGYLAQQVGELTIPTPVIGTAGQMPRATIVQALTDPTQGLRTNAAFSYQPALGGLLIDQAGRLIISVYSTYDASGAAAASHVISGPNFASMPPAIGPTTWWADPAQIAYKGVGWTAGAILPVPVGYQAALGAPFLTGQCCLSIITRTSSGPSPTTFDPQRLSTSGPTSGFRLVGYNAGAVGVPAHQTLGDCAKPGGVLFNCIVRVFGAVWPSTTRSVLFVGRNGTAPTLYGTGTSDSARAGFDANGSQAPPYTTCNGCANPWIYDPADSSHGYHGYPYQFFVWAYSADDLVSVAQGSLQPWQVVPYATWTLTLPNMPTGKADLTGGVTYKEATHQLFVSARLGGDSDRPIVYVFQLP